MRAVTLVALAVATAGCSAAQIRGVNLGSWMVLESWLVPSLFEKYNIPDGVGEWEFCQQLGSAAACREALEPHWDTWVTKDDLAKLAAAGITHLRVPIGYWISCDALAPGEPYVCGAQWPYLYRMMGWAAELGLAVLIDLHGAPGSQNGHDNSGSTEGIGWMTPGNQTRTTDFLVSLARNLTADPLTANATWGIELLNEPWTTIVGGPIALSTLADWAQNTTEALRAAGWRGAIVTPDGWSINWSGWQGWMMDQQGSMFFASHLYHCFGGETSSLSPWQQLAYACAVDGQNLRTGHPNTLPVIVDEWSLALVAGISAPYPFDADAAAYYRAFTEVQWNAYGALGTVEANVAGAMFWTFKTEAGGSPVWDYLLGLQQGYVPANLAAANASLTAARCDGFLPLPSGAVVGAGKEAHARQSHKKLLQH